MSKQDNIEAQQRFGEAVNSGNVDVIREVMAPDVVDRSLAEDAVGATVVDEGDKGGAADGLETDAAATRPTSGPPWGCTR